MLDLRYVHVTRKRDGTGYDVDGRTDSGRLELSHHAEPMGALIAVAAALGIDLPATLDRLPALDAIDDAIVRQRVRWVNERPRMPEEHDVHRALRACRDDYRYHALAQERIKKQIRALESMIEDCENAKSEARRFGESLKTG